MLGTIVVVVLQVTQPPASPAAQEPAAQEAAPVPAGMMDCEYDRATRVRLCRTSTGEVLRCRRERVLGSRFPETVCLTARQEEEMERDSRDALNRGQHTATPGVN